MSDVDYRLPIITWAVERTHHEREMGEATAELRRAVREAVKHGMTEVDAAKFAGVTRMTVRAWLGK